MAVPPLDTACPACGRSLEDGARASRCNRCGSVHHDGCWDRKGHCRGVRNCRGKPETAVVVGIPFRGPTADEVAAETELAVSRALRPLIEEVLTRMPQQAERAREREFLVKSLVQTVDGLRGSLREEAAETRGTLTNKIDKAAKTLADIDKRTLHRPKPLSRPAIESLLGALEKRLHDFFEGNSGRADDLVTQTLTGVACDVRHAIESIEACRWELAAEQRPLPWEQQDRPTIGLPSDT